MAKAIQKNKLSIVVLTIDSTAMVKQELDDISKLNTKGLDVSCVVVDNGATDETEKAIKNYKFKNIKYKYIRTGKNLGFSGGNNVGIKHSLKNKSDYVLVLNDDMELSKDLLLELVTFMNKNPKVGIVSPKIYFAKGYEFHRDRYKQSEKGKVIWYAGGNIDWDNIYSSHRGVDEVDRGQYDKPVKTDVACGACMLVRKEVFEKVGLLDEDLFLYWEDADFSRRVIKNGFDLYYLPTTAVWHKVSASAGGSGSKSNDYFLVRNRLYFAMRYAKLRTKVAVLRDTLKLAFVGRDWQKLGARHALIGLKGAGPWVK